MLSGIEVLGTSWVVWGCLALVLAPLLSSRHGCNGTLKPTVERL